MTIAMRETKSYYLNKISLVCKSDKRWKDQVNMVAIQCRGRRERGYLASFKSIVSAKTFKLVLGTNISLRMSGYKSASFKRFCGQNLQFLVIPKLRRYQRFHCSSLLHVPAESNYFKII